MGQRIHVETFDDTDPSKEATYTDEIWWKGKLLEVDLCEENHNALVALLEPFVKVARKKEVGDSSKATTPTGKPSLSTEAARASKERTKIRKWARRNGYPTLGSNGVIPNIVIEEFHEFEGKDKPEFADPDAVPVRYDIGDFPDEEQVQMKLWITSLGLNWPRKPTLKNRIALEAWGDRNETLAKEILEDYAK